MRILLKVYKFALLVTIISAVSQSAVALERAGRIERIDLEDGIISINGTTYSVNPETLRVNWENRALDSYLLESGLYVIFTVNGHEDDTIGMVTEIKVTGPASKVKEFFNH